MLANHAKDDFTAKLKGTMTEISLRGHWRYGESLTEGAERRLVSIQFVNRGLLA